MKAVFPFILFIASLSRTLLADGVFVWNQGVDLYEPSQKAVILHDDGIVEDAARRLGVSVPGEMSPGPVPIGKLPVGRDGDCPLHPLIELVEGSGPARK